MASSSRDKRQRPIEDPKRLGPIVEVPFITLKIKGQRGNELTYKIKRNTQLKKIMDAYCERQSENANAIVFLYDGRKLSGEKTPEDLKMKDGDEIDAMLHQTGGHLINHA